MRFWNKVVFDISVGIYYDMIYASYPGGTPPKFFGVSWVEYPTHKHAGLG